MIDARHIAPETIRRLKRWEYDQLVALGAFEDERVELLHGVIVEMSPQKPPHSGSTQELTQLLVPALVGRAVVRIQLPFAASDDSEPEPDVAVVAPGRYMDEHPGAAFLIVEVADSSLKKDRVIKPGIYAACGVPEYWVVDVRGGLVDRYLEPSATGYARIDRFGRGASIPLAAFPDVSLRTDDFLP